MGNSEPDDVHAYLSLYIMPHHTTAGRGGVEVGHWSSHRETGIGYHDASMDDQPVTAPTPERPKTRRRIIKRIALLVCGAVVLLANYLLSYGALNWWIAREIQYGTSNTAVETFTVVEPVYRPLQVFMTSDLPGSRVLMTYIGWCQSHGYDEPASWSAIREEVDDYYDAPIH